MAQTADVAALIDLYFEAIRLASFDTLDSIQAGAADLAYVNARDAAHYAHLMMRDMARQR